jgi:putative membrane protein
MMWYWGTGGAWWMWIVGVLMMLLFWGGVAALVVFLVRGLGGPRQAHPDSAMDTLRRRLAAGEITQEEFERIRKVIQG